MNLAEAKTFLEFLERREALPQFVRNCATGSRSLIATLKFRDPYLVINMAFRWADTPEGHAYWYNLQQDWQEFLEECQE